MSAAAATTTTTTTAATSGRRARPQTPLRRWWPAAVLLLGLLAVVIVALLVSVPRGRVARQPLPPSTFVATMGYEPTTLVLPDGAVRIAKPTGTCSSLWGGQPFNFTPACQAHDYGYDVLRHAAAEGTPLPASTRRGIDAVFARDLHATCATDERGAPASACHGLARLWVAAVGLNSWRQHDGPPGREPVTAWLLAVAALPAVGVGGRAVRARLATAAAAGAARTPAERDRYADLLRTVSILIVVLGHWLMIVVARSTAGVVGDNLLAVAPALQPATWLLQVLPVVFFVGGFANLTTWRRAVAGGTGVADYLVGRVRRLVGPTVVLAAAWMAAGPLLHGVGVPAGQVDLATRLVAQPLWFLAVYLAVAAVAPLMSRLHTQFGVWVVAVLALATAAVDVASIGLGMAGIGWLNLALVWLCVHQCGFFYADARVQARPRRTFVAFAAGGLATLIILTHVGPYPVSMVGVPGATMSNMTPPTVAILALAALQIGVVMLLRAPLTALLARPRVWSAVALVGSAAITLFLWHLTAAVAAIGVALAVAAPLPAPGGAHWWIDRPAWLAAYTLILVPIASLLAPLEWRRGRPRADGPARTLPAVTATVAGVAGCACLALAGFTSSLTALTGTVLLMAAAALTRCRGTTPDSGPLVWLQRERTRADHARGVATAPLLVGDTPTANCRTARPDRPWHATSPPARSPSAQSGTTV